MCILVNGSGCLSSRAALGLWLLVLVVAAPGCGPKIEVVERVMWFSQIAPSPVKWPGEEDVICPHSSTLAFYSMGGPMWGEGGSNPVQIAPGESVELLVAHTFRGRGNHRYKFIGWRGKYIELEEHLCVSVFKPDEMKRILVLPYYQTGEERIPASERTGQPTRRSSGREKTAPLSLNVMQTIDVRILPEQTMGAIIGIVVLMAAVLIPLVFDFRRRRRDERLIRAWVDEHHYALLSLYGPGPGFGILERTWMYEVKCRMNREASFQSMSRSVPVAILRAGVGRQLEFRPWRAILLAWPGGPIEWHNKRVQRTPTCVGTADAKRWAQKRRR